jgi:glycosyltransferase involved in cell wall biosynthesis
MPTAPLRILHAPANIANQAGYVANALRRLGHTVEVWDTVDRFGFPVDRVLEGARGGPAQQWAVFLEALDRFDVVHFHFRQSLLMPGWTGLPPFWDLPVYRALGKRVFFTFHGSDVRTRRVNERIDPWSAYRQSAISTDDDRTEKELQVVRTYADRMFVASILLRPFVPDAEYMPRAIDLAEWPELPAPRHARPVVLHVASHPTTKGTPMIREGLRRLAGDGLDFEFRVLEGVAHAEVRTAIAEADILVDNVIAGSYGVSGMEAMASGRVAVANLGEPVLAAHPDCPVVNVDPNTFPDVMRRLIADPEERSRRAVEGRAFVARVHDAPVIAARLLEAYTVEPGPVHWTMPDWVAFNSQRGYERLEATAARLQLDLAAARLRETSYRRRLGLPPADPGPSAASGPSIAYGRLRSMARAVLPKGLRRRLRRLRDR